MTYGAEGWALRQQDIQKIDSAETWLYVYGEEWSERRCGLSTQKEDVTDVHPSDAEEEEGEQQNLFSQ